MPFFVQRLLHALIWGTLFGWHPITSAQSLPPQIPVAASLAVREVPEQWIAITESSAVDAATAWRFTPTVVAAWVRDGFSHGDHIRVQTSKRVFVDCAKKLWGYAPTVMQIINAEYAYQVRLLDVFCKLSTQANAADTRPLHGVNAEQALEADNTVLGLRKLKYDAGLGDATAALQLFGIFRDGKLVPTDLAQAGDWVRLAANSGHRSAQFQLGVYLSEGIQGFEKNQIEAATWLQRAAEQGHAMSMLWVGDIFQYGSGIARDKDKALEWYRKAQAAGVKDAQERIVKLQVL
jgi:Sel1 repeat